jgi:DNA-binding CsgD family transcriptional regulator
VGRGQTEIAAEMGLAPSTVALNAQIALAQLGVDAKPSRVNAVLAFAVRAVVSQTPFHADLRCEASSLHVQVTRRDASLLASLPPSEREVIRRLIDGASYADIAKSRATSTRTVANQITSAFRRLRIAGRMELLGMLAEHEVAPRPPGGFTADQRLSNLELELVVLRRRVNDLEEALKDTNSARRIA